MKNLPEFKALVLRYESITIEEIKEANLSLNLLTGFGSVYSCTLCRAIDSFVMRNSCKIGNCVWSKTVKTHIIEIGTPCFLRDNEKTYDAIETAKTAKNLLTAYRNRAKHMRKVLKKLNIEMP